MTSGDQVTVVLDGLTILRVMGTRGTSVDPLARGRVELPVDLPPGVFRVNFGGGTCFARDQDEGTTWCVGWVKGHDEAGRALLAAHALAGPGNGRTSAWVNALTR